MHGSWGGYLPAFWSHASVHPDLFTTECLLYLRDGECATRRGLRSGRAVPQYVPHFGAAKWRAVGSPYFQACAIEARQALTLVPRGAVRRTPARPLRYGFAPRRNWPPTGRSM